MISIEALQWPCWRVRSLEDQVKVELQKRAARHGRSMEQELQEILRSAIRAEQPGAGGLGTAIVALFSGSGLGFALPEMPSWTVDMISFVEDDDDFA